MRPKLSLLVPLVVVLALVAATASSSGASPKATIANLRVEPTPERLLLSFRLADAFDDDLRQRIESGLATGFSFRIRLLRDRKRWFDKGVAATDLQVVAMYNAVTREYLINFKHDGDLIESRVVRDPETLEQAMTEFDRLPAFTAEQLPTASRSGKLQVRVRAELGTKTILSLIPATITTDWAESTIFQPTLHGS